MLVENTLFGVEDKVQSGETIGRASGDGIVRIKRFEEYR